MVAAASGRSCWSAVPPPSVEIPSPSPDLPLTTIELGSAPPHDYYRWSRVVLGHSSLDILAVGGGGLRGVALPDPPPLL